MVCMGSLGMATVAGVGLLLFLSSLLLHCSELACSSKIELGVPLCPFKLVLPLSLSSVFCD